jgi:hypothetical protein
MRLLEQRPDEGNPYEYSLGALAEVDPALILYREKSSFMLPSDLGAARGIAIDTGDRVYIAAAQAWAVFDHAGQELARTPLPSPGTCITVVDNGSRTIVGTQSGTLLVYSESCELLQTVDGLPKNAILTAVATADNWLFAADAHNRVVHRLDLKTGDRMEIDGTDHGRRKKVFAVPSPFFDLLADPEAGRLWVVNPGERALEAYDYNGNLITGWARISAQLDGFSGCCNPTSIAQLSDGSFVTAEKGITRVKSYTERGDFTGVVAAPKQFDDGTSGLDLAADTRDRIHVLDPKRGQVRIFIEK